MDLKEFLTVWLRPVDIIAVVMIFGCLYLKSLGFDGTVDATLALIAAFYFGLRVNGLKKTK